jgi:hypothetical protein
MAQETFKHNMEKLQGEPKLGNTGGSGVTLASGTGKGPGHNGAHDRTGKGDGTNSAFSGADKGEIHHVTDETD